VVTGKAVFVKPDGTTTDGTVTNDGSSVKVGNDTKYFNVTLNNSAIAETNELTLQAGGQTTIAGAGFKPGSKVEIWIFSTPKLLGTATADTTGAFSFNAAIPSEISGSHTLHVEGIDSADASFAIAYGVTVAAAKTEVPFTGPGLNTTLLFLALLCGALGVAVRRRTLA
jgi:hypothetical protein